MQALLVHLDHLVIKASKEMQEGMVLEVPRAPLVSLVLVVSLDPKEPQEVMALVDPLAPLALLALPATRVCKVTLVRKVNQVKKATLDRLVPVEKLVYLAVQESQDPLELKEVKATLVLQVMMGHLDQRDREELLELLV